MMEEKNPASDQIEENQPIRQNLVNTAVNFLLNPDVILRSEDSKESFLKKKGLTEAEISLAFDRANNDPRYNAQRMNYGAPPPLPPVSQNVKSSFLSRLSSFSSSVIALGIAVYGIHHFYKLYLEPWLFGRDRSQDQFSQMKQQLSDMNGSLSQLQKIVATLEETINTQKMQMDRFLQNEVNEYLPTPLVLKDLKTELGSVKSLLLSRHQFPAMPKVAASIPSWQLPAKEEDISEKAENEKQPVANDSSSDPEAGEILTLPQTVVNGESSVDLNREAEFKDEVES